MSRRPAAADPIVFVHEYGSDCREWETQVRYFSRSYRCITYNARGYPPSECPTIPPRYGWEFARDDIAAVMRGLGIEKAHVVGLSMGGYAALQFAHRLSAHGARRRGGRRRLGLAQGRARRMAGTLRSARREPARARHGRLAEEIGSGPTRIQLARKDPRGCDEFMAHLRSIRRSAWPTRWRGTSALRPSLVRFRRRTRHASDARAARSRRRGRALPRGQPLAQAYHSRRRPVGLPNTGHAINLEEPAAFNAAIAEFLAAVERGTWPVRKVSGG